MWHSFQKFRQINFSLERHNVNQFDEKRAVRTALGENSDITYHTLKTELLAINLQKR